MNRIPRISEASMRAGEALIPELAAQAGRAAHHRALAQNGTVLMKSASGMLVEQRANGTERVVKPLPASTPVRAGAVLTRSRTKQAIEKPLKASSDAP